MKILQITSTFFPVIGGQEKVVYEISKRIVKKGHEVTILTTDLFCKEKNIIKEEIIDGIKIIRFKNDLYLGGYGYSKDAINWLKENWKKFDVVHSQGYNRFLSEFAIKILSKKVPIIFSPHGFIHTKKNYFFKVIHDLTIGKYIKKANYCTALTKLDYEYYKKLGVNIKKIVEIPNGVDVEKFSKISKEYVEKFKEKYKIKSPSLLYVGRIHKSKGLQYVVDAIKNLDVQLVIVGNDAGYKEKLKKQIKKIGLENRIIFTESLNDKELNSAYYASDIFILFSGWEGFGIVIIEAMATGKPVIVSDRGALPYLVKNKKNGLVVPFKNIKKLEESIKFLIENKKELRRIEDEGKKFAKKYDWKNIVNKYEKLYKDAKNNS
jgi:glycosyltransferase involved in cell wall biosynthesis